MSNILQPNSAENRELQWKGREMGLILARFQPSGVWSLTAEGGSGSFVPATSPNTWTITGGSSGGLTGLQPQLR